VLITTAKSNWGRRERKREGGRCRTGSRRLEAGRKEKVWS